MTKWKFIFNRNYIISDSGIIIRAKKSQGAVVGKTLKYKLAGHGYPSIALSINGTQRRYNIHRLVALSFLGKCPIGFAVNHKDGNKQNNNVSNLEYLSYSDNMAHYSGKKVVRNGKVYKSRREASRCLGIPKSTLNAQENLRGSK